MWRHILWNAGYFGCIFQVRAMLPANPTNQKSIQVRNDLISGAIGGTIGTVLNTPLDVVKSRIGELEFERDQLDNYLHQT